MRGTGQNFPTGPYVIIIKQEKQCFTIYILHFIAYYPALTQLGFILLVKQSCIKKI